MDPTDIDFGKSKYLTIGMAIALVLLVLLVVMYIMQKHASVVFGG